MTVRDGRAGQTKTERVRIVVTGAVQGVGFRPYVWREATARSLCGFVVNTAAGVTVEAEGASDAITGLVAALREAPPPATVAGVATEAIAVTGDSGFTIRESETGGVRSAAVQPDLATCDACLAEIADPANRRHRYPFTNCTRCGPRYTIVTDLPYDRARTTMASFVMCEACQAEYETPADRRFHAEPNACPVCGPQLRLWDAKGKTLAAGDKALRVTAEALAQGNIVAVKGLGGFHLMADARNEATIRALRDRKHREAKPFAVMFATLAAVREAADLDDMEAGLLTSREAPIVLLRRRTDSRLSEEVAPDNPLIGAMLPYTPLHHLLLAATGFPVLATSGNRSDEPICTGEIEALHRLGDIADLFLIHDRPIARPVDDSVVRVIAGRPTVLRRARGYAPAIVATGIAPGVLAVGGHLKTALALSTNAGVVLGQHLGDLETPEAHDAYEQGLDDIQRLHDVHVPLVVHDLHPDYHSTRKAAELGVSAVAVQHHLAHVAACMAEHGQEPPLLGVAFDGTGFGTDGTIWGGEFLHVSPGGWKRAAHLRQFSLPGGEAAVRQPRRSALGLLYAAFGAEAFGMTDLAPVAAFTPGECAALETMLERGVSAPVTTSAGRLFDAVASLVGLCQRARYEGEAAMVLEWDAMKSPSNNIAYPFDITRESEPLILDWRPALEAIIADIRGGVDTCVIAARFHDGLALAIAGVAATIGEETVALSGGCFQNARLTEQTLAALQARGLKPLRHERVPPNDGGLALGQAWWAARFAGAV